MGNGQFNYKLLEELWYATVHYNIDYIAHQTTHAYIQIHTYNVLTIPKNTKTESLVLRHMPSQLD